MWLETPCSAWSRSGLSVRKLVKLSMNLKIGTVSSRLVIWSICQLIFPIKCFFYKNHQTKHLVSRAGIPFFPLFKFLKERKTFLRTGFWPKCSLFCFDLGLYGSNTGHTLTQLNKRQLFMFVVWQSKIVTVVAPCLTLILFSIMQKILYFPLFSDLYILYLLWGIKKGNWSGKMNGFSRPTQVVIRWGNIL